MEIGDKFKTNLPIVLTPIFAIIIQKTLFHVFYLYTIQIYDIDGKKLFIMECFSDLLKEKIDKFPWEE